jgi:hypothetical protein
MGPMTVPEVVQRIDPYFGAGVGWEDTPNGQG